MAKESVLKVVEALTSSHKDAIVEVTGHAGDTLVIVTRDSIIQVLTYLKNEHNFIYLADIFGTDRFTEEDRFEVIYNIVSLRDGHRLFIKTRCPEEDPTMPTACGIWDAANWNEREVYDMFGIRFDGHPDARRIFLPEDFEYFPLRKEFPLIGVPGSLELPSTNPDAE